eukprot:UN06207
MLFALQKGEDLFQKEMGIELTLKQLKDEKDDCCVYKAGIEAFFQRYDNHDFRTLPSFMCLRSNESRLSNNDAIRPLPTLMDRRSNESNFFRKHKT